MRIAVPAARDVRLLSYLCALSTALVLGHFLLGIPIQFSDSFDAMLKLSTAWADLLHGELTQRAYLRPLRWAELKLVHDLSGGSYFPWFRGTHVIQVVVLALLYVGLVRPRTAGDAALVPFGLAILIGMHTFGGTIKEAFPINHFLTVLLFCFAAAHVALAQPRWWNDVAAMVLFAAAALTLESGLLVWVIFIGSRLVGARGISRAGVLGLSVLLAGYFLLRFAVLDVGSPGLTERSSGFGFRILEPAELVERFGDNPIGFYLYNVVASILSVLVSEPSGGVFQLTSALVRGSLSASTVVTLIATTSVTALIAAYLWRRRRVWLSRQFERDDQLVALFGMVLVANAALSYAYTKDVIMSPAGALFAVAGFVAARHALASMPTAASPRRAAATLGLAAVVGSAWAFRAGAAHLDLRTAAYTVRAEWAYAEGSLQDDGVELSAAEMALFRALREDALLDRRPPPTLDPPFDPLFEVE